MTDEPPQLPLDEEELDKMDDIQLPELETQVPTLCRSKTVSVPPSDYKVDEKTQSMYSSGVGTLLYLTKHSRPDITNPMRELLKSLDGASVAHVTEMYRVINFVLEMKTLGLRMVPTFKDGIWKLEALSDS